MSAAARPGPTQAPQEAPLRLRLPGVVMSARRAAAAWSGPMSFARGFVDRLQREGWRVQRLRMDLDAAGRGEVVYRLQRGERAFHFIALCSAFSPEDKIDRSYGVNWDICAAFCDGAWTPEREAQLRCELPKQRLGRFDNDTLGYTRGNRSDRLFDELVEGLAEGRQPDPRQLATVGYIFRTTGFTANGLLGMRSFHGLAETGLPASPYYAQMATAYLLRECVADMADHMARLRNPQAAQLHPDYRRYLGIGNSAGLGLIPFIHNHPCLLDHWIRARETAFALALERPAPPAAPDVARVAALLNKASRCLAEDGRDGNGIFADWRVLAQEMAEIAAEVRDYAATGRFAGAAVPSLWPALVAATDASRSAEAAELLREVLLEAYPDIVAQCRPEGAVDETLRVDPAMSLGALRDLVRRDWGWLQEIEGGADCSHFWYYPDEAPYEPRRGLRGRLPEHEHETAMDAPLRIPQLLAALDALPADAPVATLLSAQPALRAIVARVQTLADHPYGIFRENSLRQGYSPFAAERLVLSCFGMEKLDPRAPRSVKGALLQGAPTAADLASGRPGAWPFAPLPQVDGSSKGAVLTPLRLLERPDAPAQQLRRVKALVENPDVQNAEFWHTSPIELRKYALRVMQAMRQPLGQGQEVARLVEFAHSRCGIGLAGLIALAERGGQDSALLQAPAALDAAVAAASREGMGTARLQGRDLSLLDGLPVMAAHLGYAALLVWSSEHGREALGDARLVVALPGPSFAATSQPDPRWSGLTGIDPAPAGGAVLACWRADRVPAALPQLLPGGADPDAFARFRQAQESAGIRIRRSEWQQVQALAQPSWLPIGLEPQILPA